MKAIINNIKMRLLPKNWWQFASTTSIQMKQYKSHILGLLLAIWNGNDFQYSVYSGIPLFYKGRLIWITAGHIIDEIHEILSSQSIRVDIICWLDDYGIKGAEGVWFHKRDPIMSSWKGKGTDIGLMVINELDQGNLFKNRNFKPILPYIWLNPKNEVPEGYYAIGYPRVWSSHSQREIGPKEISHFVKADILCLPLRKINRETQILDNECWKKENAFIGSIEKYPDDPNFTIESINGMSGGPIFSIQRKKNKGLLYRLIGIISECDAQQSMICGESILDFENIMVDWIESNM
jgi:hypothetical protein